MSSRFNLAALSVLAAVAALACGASGPGNARSASLPEPAPPAEATVQSPAPDPDVGSSVGNRAPNFEMRLADGTLVNSASLIAESRPTFLYFFATW